jgi:hypothetical protein
MRKEGFLYIPFVTLLLFMFFTFESVRAQTTDEEIKLVKEQIEQLNQRLEELEAKKSREQQEAGLKSKASTPDPVTFLNSSGAGTNKTSGPGTPRTLITGSGTLALTDAGDPHRFNALFSPTLHRQLVNNLHLVLKPEIKLQEDKVDVGLGVGEVDYFLSDYLTLRGGKLQSPFSILSEKSYASWINNTQYLPSLYPRTENMPSQDILSDLKNMGVGISGGIPLKFFEDTNINYGVSFVNGVSGPGIMNFSFTISQKQ